MSVYFFFNFLYILDNTDKLILHRHDFSCVQMTSISNFACKEHVMTVRSVHVYNAAYDLVVTSLLLLVVVINKLFQINN